MTQMKTHKIIPILIVLIAGLIACDNQQVEGITQNSSKRPVRKIYASEFASTSIEDLTYNTSLDEDLICPVIARYAAMYELLEGSYQLLNDLSTGDVYSADGQNEQIVYHSYLQNVEWTLTANPRVIYNYDGSVKYYEFGLVEDNQVTSTITVYAKPEAPRAIAYMFPYVLPYEHVDKDYYVGNYPHRVFHDGIGYRDIEDSDPINYISLDTLNYWSQIYAQSTSEEVAEWDVLRQNSNTPDTQYEDEAEVYWSKVYDAINETANTLEIDPPCVEESRPPKNIENTYIESLKDYLGTASYCRDYTASPYRGTTLQQTRWTGACGPAALAWVYRGIYEEYPPRVGDYLPLHGYGSRSYFSDGLEHGFYYYGLDTLDNYPSFFYFWVKNMYINQSQDVDNGLTANFYERSLAVKSGGVWQFALAPCSLDNALEDATNGELSVYSDCDAITAAGWIHDYNLPVLILYTDLSHYIVAYGYGAITDTYNGDISRKNLYFLVTDNGYEIRNTDYKPHWRHYKACEYYHRVYRN